MRVWRVNVISSTTIKRYAALHADAAEELLRWNKAATHAVWRDINDVRLLFPDADQYKSLLIFNIRHNYYRLVVKVDYRAKLLMIKEFLKDRKSTRLNSSHQIISYAVFCLKKKTTIHRGWITSTGSRLQCVVQS